MCGDNTIQSDPIKQPKCIRRTCRLSVRNPGLSSFCQYQKSEESGVAPVCTPMSIAVKKIRCPSLILQSTMAILNTNPEVLLKKRKDADRKRIQKQDALRVKKENRARKSVAPKDKFVRAETLAIRNRAISLEDKRVANVLKHELKANRVLSSKEIDSKLVFIIRIDPKNKTLKIPAKAKAVLEVLRLTQPNMGVFVKMTSTVAPVLKLVAPYIVVGKPSLASVRELFQKRACIPSVDEDQNEVLVKLDNNQAVEDKFGDDYGFICIEDLVHEIVTLGEGFKTVNQWIAPFKLTAPINGWGPLAKLARLRYESERKKKVSLAGHANLEEIDIDKFIEEQN